MFTRITCTYIDIASPRLVAFSAALLRAVQEQQRLVAQRIDGEAHDVLRARETRDAVTDRAFGLQPLARSQSSARAKRWQQ